MMQHVAQWGGANEVTLTGDESGIQAHTHDVEGHTQVGSTVAVTFQAASIVSTRPTTSTGPVAAIDPHNNESLFVDVNFIIKV